jgi:predicted dehydrogenase
MANAPVNLGLIGLGPWWENRFRPALQKLSARLDVVAIYDSVTGHAEQAARSVDADVVGGATALTERVDVQAVLVLDLGWGRELVGRMLCQRRKPVLLATTENLPLSELRHWHELASAHGLMVMPALSRRCTPASNRLQELMATQLGRPLRIEVAISPASLHVVPFATEADLGRPVPPPLDPLTEWADWCHYLFRASVQQVTRRADGFRLDFPPLAQSGQTHATTRVAELSLCPNAPIAENPLWDEVHLQCEQGTARLLGPTHIDWTTAEGSQSEELSAERSETEVLLDHFSRRVVGGLIPVPSLVDLIRARESVQS